MDGLSSSSAQFCLESGDAYFISGNGDVFYCKVPIFPGFTYATVDIRDTAVCNKEKEVRKRRIRMRFRSFSRFVRHLQRL